jgi:Retroviral aspartyl protease
LVDQLKIKKTELNKPVTLNLAVQGSHSKVKSTVTIEISYSEIRENRTFDVININSYDLILGTPWLYQHKVKMGFNFIMVEISSVVALPMKKLTSTKLLASSIMPTLSDLEVARDELHQASDHLCKDVNETNLPPF